MNKRSWSPLLIIIGLVALYLPVLPAIAGQPSEQSIIHMASTPSQPGSKEPEGLEPEPPATLSFGWDITLASKYLFQGRDYSDGKPVVQPEVTLTYKDLSAILWFNHDLHTKVSDEFDLYLQYTRETGNLSLTSGYAHVNYPHRKDWDPEQGVFIKWDPSQEVFIDLSYNTLLNPSFSIHYDFDAGGGSYSTLGIGHGIETASGVLSFGINLFYQDNYYELTGFPSMELNGNMEYSIGSFTITPSVSYFLTWDNGDFREDGPDGPVPDTWLFSINVAQSL